MLAVVAVVAATQIWRAGYSSDEEFTAFAVRGIDGHALPVLPSGLLYDRGLAYSYAAWLTRLFVESTLPAGRVVALLSALAALGALFDLVRRVSSSRASLAQAAGPAGAALLAAALVAVSLPFWAAATTARFYAPFLLFYVLTLGALARAHVGPPSLDKRRVRASAGHAPWHPGTPHTGTLAPWHLGTLSALAVLARLSHELAFTLVAIPVVAMLADRDNRRRWFLDAGAVTIGLVAAQALLFALHVGVEGAGAGDASAAPQAPGSMIDRFFIWQVVNLVAWPLDPFEFLRHIAATVPLMTAVVAVLFVLRVLGVGGRWSGPERLAHAHWMAWVVFFGVIDSGITINYLLLPVVSMLAALAIDVVALVPRRAVAAAGLALAALIGLEQWGWAPGWDRLEAVRPTVEAPAGTDLAGLAAQAEHVACSDELACLLLAGRVDTWLALDPFLRQRFIVSRNGREVGVYAGSPVVSRLDDLFVSRGGRPAPRRVLVIDVFKDLPIGSSATFLPRALAASHVEARPIVESRRMRVVELQRATQQASTGPVSGL